jgi:uncharacterized protein
MSRRVPENRMDQASNSNHAEPVPTQVTPRPSSRLIADLIFADEKGVRPIWRLLIYAGAYYALRSFLLLIVGEAIETRSDQLSPLWLLLLEECLLLMAAVLPAWFLSKLEGKSIGSYGLPARSAFGKQFWQGAAWGIAAITVLLVAMHGVGLFDFGRLAIHGIRVFKFAGFWAVFFLVVGLYEDFLFRAYSLITLSETAGFWPAALLLSILFGWIHLGNRGETWVGALGAAFIGLFFCLTLRRTGSLWFAVGMHAAWDWGESFLYSVPDSGLIVPGHFLNSSLHGPRWLSGGSVGPEGSVLLFLVIAGMWVLFNRAYPVKPTQGDAAESERTGAVGTQHTSE